MSRSTGNESAKPLRCWMLEGDGALWAVRAATDAAVAPAYGLVRDQYAHILSTFSHASHKDAPRQSLGLEAFAEKHDLYCGIPLNEALPYPLVDLSLAQTDVLKQEPEKYPKDDFFVFQVDPAGVGGREWIVERTFPKKGKCKRRPI